MREQKTTQDIMDNLDTDWGAREVQENEENLVKVREKIHRKKNEMSRSYPEFKHRIMTLARFV